jgi:phage-related holin
MKIQRAWNGLPKELKVILYVSLAAAIDQLVRELNPGMVSFVPEYLRLPVLNVIIVFFVEMSKRLKERK